MNRNIKSIIILIALFITFTSHAKENHSQLLKRIRLVDAEAYQLAMDDLNINSEKYQSALIQFEIERKELLQGVQNNNSESIKKATE